MNDIVITYRNGEGSEEKLRQILRKIENEFSGFNEIAVIGDIPEWIQGVIKIPHRYDNDIRWIMRDNLKMLQCACLNQDISLNFLWIDYLDTLYRIDASKACRIPMSKSMTHVGHRKITFQHTQRLLERRGFQFTDYFSRFPISFSKINLMKTFDLVDFETLYGYDIKTLYVNFNRYKPAIQCQWLKSDHYDEKSSYETY